MHTWRVHHWDHTTPTDHDNRHFKQLSSFSLLRQTTRRRRRNKRKKKKKKKKRTSTASVAAPECELTWLDRIGSLAHRYTCIHLHRVGPYSAPFKSISHFTCHAAFLLPSRCISFFLLLGDSTRLDSTRATPKEGHKEGHRKEEGERKKCHPTTLTRVVISSNPIYLLSPHACESIVWW